LYLSDILEAISKVKKYTQDMTASEFAGNDLVLDAVLRNLEVIGEIAAQIPESFREEHNYIPWRDIKNFRNVVIHKYHQIDIDTVWNIVQEELDILQSQIEDVQNK